MRPQLLDDLYALDGRIRDLAAGESRDDSIGAVVLDLIAVVKLMVENITTSSFR